MVPDALVNEIQSVSPTAVMSYLSGAARDATYSCRHKTWRLSQKGPEWLEVASLLLSRLGCRSWTYQESRRLVWTLETTYDMSPFNYPMTSENRIAFARGYFDAEGGVPRLATARFYVQFCQKNKDDLSVVRSALEQENISCGRIHNPSARIDPNYWRFFVRAHSHALFVERIHSWHPRKRLLMKSFLEGQLGELKTPDLFRQAHC